MASKKNTALWPAHVLALVILAAIASGGTLTALVRAWCAAIEFKVGGIFE